MHGMPVHTEWTGAQLWAGDLLLMTSHENADTANEQMTPPMEVLIADADEKHYSYSACKGGSPFYPRGGGAFGDIEQPGGGD
jgi:hypothetical protein